MKELINVVENNGKQAVDARELHMALEVGRDFSTWIKDRIDKYGFEAGEDYFKLEGFLPDLAKTSDDKEVFTESGENLGGRPKIDYLLSINMAKEIALVENNEIGRKIRRYLIKVEEAWNNPDMVLHRAAQMSGLAYKDAVECAIDNTVEEFKEITMGMVICPFPGGSGKPVRVKRYSTTKGGRVYVLTYDNKTINRHILAYNADGEFAGEGIAKERRDGTPIGEGFSQFGDLHEKKLGKTHSVVWNAPIDDYLNWKAEIIKEKCLKEALPVLPALEDKLALGETATGNSVAETTFYEKNDDDDFAVRPCSRPDIEAILEAREKERDMLA